MLRFRNWRLWFACVAAWVGVALSVAGGDHGTNDDRKLAVAAELSLQTRLREYRLDRIPLRQALSELSRRSGVAIELDPLIERPLRARYERQPVTVHLHDVGLQTAIEVCAREAGRDLELIYSDDGKALLTLPRTNALRARERSYDLRDLILSPDPSDERLVNEIRRLVVETVSPQSWSEQQGVRARVDGSRLIVRQTPENLRLTEALLIQLAKHDFDAKTFS